MFPESQQNHTKAPSIQIRTEKAVKQVILLTSFFSLEWMNTRAAYSLWNLSCMLLAHPYV